VSAQALFELHDVIHVRVELRAPKKGDLMWSVPADATIEDALDHVICGRDSWPSGEAGFGYYAQADQPEFETWHDERLRNIVVHVDHVRTEPVSNNIVPYVKRL
jgi:hypothetical protein